MNEKLRRIWRELGIEQRLISERLLPTYDEPSELVKVAGEKRTFLMAPRVARQWRLLSKAAVQDGIVIFLISAFRDYEYQADLIRRRLARDEVLSDILRVLAPPGCSEHHTGAALDLGTPGCPALAEEFEQTAAFKWLTQNAATYGFVLSYPRQNRFGYIYEPWHWSYTDIGRDPIFS